MEEIKLSEEEIKLLEKQIEEDENAFYQQLLPLRDTENKLIEEKVKLKKSNLHAQFNAFVKKKELENKVYLNIDLLHAVVKSYYDDIHRYKHFAYAERANSLKQAAYTIKWIAKFRPIQIQEGTYVSLPIFDVNLIFALICGFSLLDRKIIDLIMKDKAKTDYENKMKKEEDRDDSFYDKLLYIIRYRPLSGRQLASMFEALELAFLVFTHTFANLHEQCNLIPEIGGSRRSDKSYNN